MPRPPRGNLSSFSAVGVVLARLDSKPGLKACNRQAMRAVVENYGDYVIGDLAAVFDGIPDCMTIKQPLLELWAQASGFPPPETAETMQHSDLISPDELAAYKRAIVNSKSTT